MKQNTVSRAN